MSPEFAWDDAQRAAVEWGGREILVSAGAGTGKTSVLVGRVLHKLAVEKVPLDALLVVTFTEKAAREMRERIHKEVARDPALRRHLPDLPRAAICTIDSFCKRLLAEHFLEADVEPGFRVLDPRGQEEGMQEALRRAFHEAYTAEPEEEQARFRRLVDLAGYDKEGEALRDVVRRIHDQARVSPDWSRFLGALEEARDPERVDDIPWYPAYLEMLRARWAEGTLLYREAIDRLAAGIGQARVAAHEAHAAALEANCGVLEPGFPRAPNGARQAEGWEGRYKRAKETLREVAAQWPRDPEQVLAEARAGRRDAALLSRVVRAVDRHYAAWKARQGVLDFADMEIKARALLRTHGDALGLRDRYEEVLVDEFQDVNRLQAEILDLVSRPGRRFRVGDVKQSIYQFRLAEPSIFRELTGASEAVEDLAAPPPGDAPIALFLRRNHRSRAAILAWVNHLFARLFDRGTIGSDYARQALVAAAPGAGRHVELHLVREGKIEDEARLVAERLPVWLAEMNGRYADAAILLRTGKQTAPFLDALRARGIPARIREGGSLFDEPMVRDLRMLLSVIDNPRDDVALAAALRSPLARLDDEDLARIRLARPEARSFLDAALAGLLEAWPDAGRFVPVADGEEAKAALEAWAGPARGDVPRQARLRRFLERILEWREREQRVSLVHLLTEITRAAPFDALLATLPDAAAQRIFLDRFLALAGEYQAERGSSLRGFLARVDTLALGRGAEALTGTTGVEDAVEILTIHAAKGLEWPLVIVPRLGWRFQEDRKLGATIRIGPAGVGVSAFDGETWTRRETCLQRLLKWTTRGDTRREEARVAYVAMTRARERLVLVGSHKRDGVELLGDRTTSAGSALDWILDAVNEAAPIEITRHEPSGSLPAAPPPPPPAREPLVNLDAVIERITRAPVSRLEGIRGKYWVTEFKRPGDEARFRELEETEAASLLLPAAEAARRGTLYHAAFSRLDLTAPAAAQFVRFASEPWWEGEREPRLEEGFTTFLATPLGERLAAAAARGEVEREAPFSLKWSIRRLAALRPDLLPAPPEALPGDLWVLLQGRLDCVFKEGARHVVIDWKTDRVAPVEALTRAEGYASQMELYGEAVAALWGGEVECWLVFVGAGGLCLRAGAARGSGGRSSPPRS